MSESLQIPALRCCKDGCDDRSFVDDLSCDARAQAIEQGWAVWFEEGDDFGSLPDSGDAFCPKHRPKTN